MITLTNDQQYALDTMKQGKNIFLTGPAGVGKSVVIEEYYKYLIQNEKNAYKTSTTGISALNIGGKTIHSWAGIRLGEGSVETLIKNMYFKTTKKWKETDVLFIDEVSMLSPELFEKLNIIAMRLRKTEKPFGGIQLILIGDMFQLPVVKNERFVFEAKCWDEVVDEVIEMNEIVRQKDIDFKNILNEIRYGRCSNITYDKLKERVGVKLTLPNGIEPTRLYPKNVSANQVNTKKLNMLPGELKIFNAEYILEYNYSKRSKKDLFKLLKTNVDDEIKLKKGAQVMFKKNIPEWNVVNGSRGIVKGFFGDVIIVSLVSGQEVEVIPVEYTYASDIEGDTFKVKKLQVPLKLAWATTIHASQGCTLDLVTVDCGKNIFECGQAYVALSRVTTLNGLSLIQFDRDVIEANQKVLDFYNNCKLAQVQNIQL